MGKVPARPPLRPAPSTPLPWPEVVRRVRRLFSAPPAQYGMPAERFSDPLDALNPYQPGSPLWALSVLDAPSPPAKPALSPACDPSPASSSDSSPASDCTSTDSYSSSGSDF